MVAFSLLVLAVVLAVADMVVSHTDPPNQIGSSTFQTDIILKQTRTKVTPTKVQTLYKKNSSLWSADVSRSSRKAKCDQTCLFPESSCDCSTTWSVQDIVTSLRHCGWRHPVVVISSFCVDSSSSCSSVFLNKLDKKESVFPRHRHKAALNAFRNLNRLPASLIVQDVLKAFHDLLLPVQHFQLNSSSEEDLQRQLEEIIWTSYTSTGIRNFVWISHKPWEIMQAARTLFRRHQRGRGALMPHRARFVLIGVETRDKLPTAKNTTEPNASSSSPQSSVSRCSPCSSMLFKETEKQLATSEFDNVLLFTFSNNIESFEWPHSGSPCLLDKPQTLMWRENRSREFGPVSNRLVRPSSETFLKFHHRYQHQRVVKQPCGLYPNIQTGMNGRRLVLLSKEWENFLEVKGQDGSVSYTGLLYEIANVLSISMNFTYLFYPPVSDSENMSWSDVRDMLISGGVGDCLFSLYYITASQAYNFSQPYPIFNINMTGAYVSRPQARVRLFISRLDPQILVVSTTAFGLVILFYSCLCGVAKRWLSSKGSEDSIALQQDCKVSCLKDYLNQCWQMLFALLGSCFAQGNVPQSRLFSGRLLLFFWCITVLTLSATFKGYLASSLVNVDSTPPFKTFGELVKRDDYRWGHYQESTFLPVMKAAKGMTLKALYSGMMAFVKDDPEVLALTAFCSFNMPVKKKGKKGSGGKKKGKKGSKKSSKSRSTSEASNVVDERPPLLRPGEKLVDLLTSHPVDKKEVHGIKVSTKVLLQLTPQEVRDLRIVFDIFDTNSDDLIGPVDLKKALRTLGFKLTKEQAVQKIEDTGLKGRKEVDFNEFLEIVIDLQGDTRDIYDEILKGFQMFDFDGSGHISLEKLRRACTSAGIKFTQKELEEMMEEADVNGDGRVDQSEFIRIMLQTNLF
ncbi:caltractin [Elysia marginata]|uniref:Caltractin n=1 Tax=Elysia marginata TaxID=1093978 RepID=A0AAV4FLY6_9GAST|nr:caltractin [Elysia marginata]